MSLLRRAFVTLVALGAAVATAAPAVAATDPTSPPDRTVTYSGVTVKVPASWPVLTMAGSPGCIRYDRHAVYLGEPSEIDCPAHLVGRVATVQILPAQTTRTGSPAPEAQVHRPASGDEIDLAADGSAARVLITGGGADDPVATAIASSVTIDGSRPTPVTSTPAPAPTTAVTTPGGVAPTPAAPTPAAPKPAAPSPTSPQVADSVPLGFDTCSAPSLTQMNAWQGVSPYTSVGVYVGGVNAACAQPNLTPAWVADVAGSGWHLLPIYAGLQAPCAGFSNSISTSTATAAQQGAAAASDAVTQTAALGLGAGNAVYLDIESWDTTNTACTAATMAFTGAFTAGLHSAGYLSGFYSSAATGVAALVAQAQASRSFPAPDAVWFARWDGNAVTTDTAIQSTMWPNHQRAKQYQGPHNESYGGRTMNIDSDAVDAPVAPTPLSPTTGTLPMGVIGQAYSTDLAAQGGIPPYTYSVTAGSLPTGLQLGNAGAISGTPSAAGTGSMTITVTDATGATASMTYPTTVTFTDVPAANPFLADILWLAGSGVTAGFPDGTFRPTDPVLRQSMAAFLYRYAHGGTDAGTCAGASPFPVDVPAGSIFCGDIAWLASTGITQGTAPGVFDPTAPVLRQSMAAFLYRFTHAGKDAGACTGASPFTDVPAGSLFCGDIAWLASTGITQGTAPGLFSPTQPVARQSMAAFLHRLSALPN